jgi:hypothetical protein
LLGGLEAPADQPSDTEWTVVQQAARALARPSGPDGLAGDDRDRFAAGAGGADSLVVSASQKVVVIGMSDGLAGYQVFGLDPLRLISDAIGLSVAPMWSSPAVSPNERDDPQWTRGATELQFESDEQLRLRLPDGVWVDLTLPLPETIVLPTPGRDIR